MTTPHFSRYMPRFGVSFLYALGALSLLFLLLRPIQAASLGFEDGPVENISAILLLISSLVMLLHGLRRLMDHATTGLHLPLLLCVVAVAFFIFAGEEISWGQRIFGIESNDFMLQHNWQGEVNLHNLHTDLFNIAFHYGAFLFFIVLPLLRNEITALLIRFRVGVLRHLIAPKWLVAPSFIFLGMLDPRFIFVVEKPWVAFLYLFALSIGLGIIAYELIRAQRVYNYKLAGQLLLSVALIALGIYISYLQTIDTFPNTISEYKELLVAFGLCVYSLQWQPAAAPGNKNVIDVS